MRTRIDHLHSPETARSVDRWIGSPRLWMRQFWSNRLEARRPSPTTTSQPSVANTFQLIDTLVELSEEVLSRRPELSSDRDQLQQYLERTLSTQLEAALAEHRALPFHTGYAELDLQQFVLDGRLHIHHPGYRDKDLRAYAQNAMPVAPTQEHRARYQREHDQLDELYDRFWAELTSDGSVQDWKQSRATSISPRVRRELGLADTATIWLAQKHALVMPRNKAVYADGLAYLNTYQMAYLPEQDRVVVIMDHLYRDYDLDTHAQMLEHLDDRVAFPSVSEELVMQTVASLPSELRDTPAFEIFCQLEDRFPLPTPQPRSVNQSAASTLLRAEQQSKLSGLAQQRTDLNQGAAFLAQVLITEYLVCRQFPEALNGLTQRLVAAREPVMNFLLLGTSFSSEVLKQHYFETYLSAWLPKLNVHSSRNQPVTQLHNTLQTLQHQRDQLEHLDADHEHKREQSILKLAKTYPSILLEASSQAQCALGSFGGLRNLNALASANSSLGQQLLRGDLLNSAQLSQVIGSERAKDWRKGVCINPECAHAGKEQMVGECGLCYSCEMAFNGLESGMDKDQPSTGFQDWLNTSFVDPFLAAHAGKEFVRINESDMPMFIWSGVR